MQFLSEKTDFCSTKSDRANIFLPNSHKNQLELIHVRTLRSGILSNAWKSIGKYRRAQMSEFWSQVDDSGRSPCRVHQTSGLKYSSIGNA